MVVDQYSRKHPAHGYDQSGAYLLWGAGVFFLVLVHLLGYFADSGGLHRIGNKEEAEFVVGYRYTLRVAPEFQIDVSTMAGYLLAVALLLHKMQTGVMLGTICGLYFTRSRQ